MFPIVRPILPVLLLIAGMALGAQPEYGHLR